jgi:hypothetical protein
MTVTNKTFQTASQFRIIKPQKSLMSHRVNKYSIIACLLGLSIACTQPAFGNAAMPSINNVGTGNSFTPFFPEDSKLGKQIAMRSELVKVNLYPGFGVVKGEYHMFNTTTKPITIKVGYPNNGSFINDQIDDRGEGYSSKIGRVFFNELEALKVLVDGRSVTTNMLKQDGTNWHVWSMQFAPQTKTDITVYYTIDTHASKIKRGYSSSTNNGFAYILESGKLWKDKIQRGTIFIKLNDGLTDRDLLGVVPRKTLKYNQTDNYLIYRFADLEPDNSSNILINYHNKTSSNFNFGEQKAKAASYYQQIDNLVVPEKEPADTTIVDKDDFNVSGLEGMLVGMLMILVLSSPLWVPVLLGITIFGIVKFISRRWQRDRSRK